MSEKVSNMAQKSLNPVFDPANYGNIKRSELNTVLVLLGLCPTSQELQDAFERYGEYISWNEVELEAVKQRQKPPIDNVTLGAELRALIRTRQVTAKPARIANLLREVSDWSDGDLEILFEGLIEDRVLHIGEFIRRIAGPIKSVTN